MTATKPKTPQDVYDPISALALLLAMRSRQDHGAQAHADRGTMQRLLRHLGLDPDGLPYPEEIEAGIRGLIAAKEASQ